METNEPTLISFASTSISAGLIIGAILTEDPSISAMATQVFPVVTDEADLPYISYRVLKMENTPVKGMQTSDMLLMEVNCFSGTYAGSVGLAECVRNALDGKQRSYDNITMRSCSFEDREETWQDDAYVQRLIFMIKI